MGFASINIIQEIMKIIHIIEHLGWGGVNSFVYDLCEQLVNNGNEVCLIGLIGERDTYKDRSDFLESKGIVVVSLGALSRKEALFKYVPKLRKIIGDFSEGQKVICNLHLKLGVLMGAIATVGMRKVKCVETYHSLYSNYKLEYLLMKPFIKRYIACSVSAMQEMRERFHINPNKLCYVSNGINRDATVQSAEMMKKENGISILSVGRFSNQKNLHITAEAFSNVCNEDVKYKIVGSGEKETLIRKATKGNKYICIIAPQKRERILGMLHEADIVVMPSLWEGLSIFMLESMAFDNPMIISDVPALRNVFEEHSLEDGERWRLCKWGYLVSTNDVTAYEAAIKHFINNEELHDSMRQEIKKYSLMNDIKFSAKRYEEEYLMVL